MWTWLVGGVALAVALTAWSKWQDRLFAERQARRAAESRRRRQRVTERLILCHYDESGESYGGLGLAVRAAHLEPEAAPAAKPHGQPLRRRA
ncbi:MAG: hypothetical protein IT204_01930 [Fimbriimonadaceae bacterium]|nr:hypothetical protein [Fimbriimonadaceae bacterium]